MTTMIRLMEERGLVERRPHSADRRASCIYLTGCALYLVAGEPTRQYCGHSITERTWNGSNQTPRRPSSPASTRPRSSRLWVRPQPLPTNPPPDWSTWRRLGSWGASWSPRRASRCMSGHRRRNTRSSARAHVPQPGHRCWYRRTPPSPSTSAGDGDLRGDHAPGRHPPADLSG
jgi:hypothetical protein